VADSLHEQLQHLLAERIRALAAGNAFVPQNVLEQASTDDVNALLPAVFVSIAGLVEYVEPFDMGKTAARYRYEYPHLVLALKRGDGRDPRERIPYLAARDVLMRPDPSGLQGWKPPGVEGVLRARVEMGGTLTGAVRARTEPGQTTDPAGPAWLKVAGSLIIWVPVIR
jgi:hypothetical protein